MTFLRRFLWMFTIAVLLLFCRYGAATYSVFIAQSELERYYRGTSAEADIQGFSVDIIRDGVSLVTEDGSLVLVPVSEIPTTPSANTTITTTTPVTMTTISQQLSSSAMPDLSTTTSPVELFPTESAVVELTQSSTQVFPEFPSTSEVPEDIYSTPSTTESPTISQQPPSSAMPDLSTTTSPAELTPSATESPTISQQPPSSAMPDLSTTTSPAELFPTESAVIELTQSSTEVFPEFPSTSEVPEDLYSTPSATESPQVSTVSQLIHEVSSTAIVVEATTSSIPAPSLTKVSSELFSTVSSASPTSFPSLVNMQTTIVSASPVSTANLEDITSTPLSTVAPTGISVTMTTPPPSTRIPVSSVTEMGPGPVESGSGMGSETGSGMELPDSGFFRRRRSAISPLPLPNMLPPLPSHVDRVTFTWVANSTVMYELSLSATPVGHFSALTPDIPYSGEIPRSQSDFSIEFPCLPSSSGVGVVTIKLNTTIRSTDPMIMMPDNILTTNFNIRKHCNDTPISTPTPESAAMPSLTSTSSNTPLTSTPAATPPQLGGGPTVPAPPGGSPAESQFVTLLLLVFAPVVGVLVLSIIIVCCSVCICCCCCGRKKRSHYSDDPADLPMNALSRDDFLYPVTLDDVAVKKDEAPVSLWMALSWGDVDSLPTGVKGVVKTYSVDRRSLSILGTLSRGDFGCIVNGQLNLDRTDPVSGSKGVMMKLYIGFQKQHGHRDEISKFLECATLLRDSDHPNVHSPLRVSVEDNYVPIVIYPIMEYGNMYQFLTLCRVTPADSPLSPVTIAHKVSFAIQIASGMKHLSEKGIVHPDLALRNCYLHTNYLVKVSDGALSQCFYPECYSTVRGTVRPVRWAAIETLQEGLCTSQSNIWSYGVTVWEILTLAKLPYCTELDHDRGVVTHLLMDHRLPQPDQSPDTLYALLLDCWKKRAEDRPHFSALLAVLSEIQSLHPVIQQSPSTAAAVTGASDTNYSTFGKDLRPQISVTEIPTGFPNQRRRRSSVRLSRNNSTVSQRNSSAYHLAPDASSQDGVSLTFSVLSDENFLKQGSDNEDDLEGTEIQIPAFLTGNSDEDLANFSPPQQNPQPAAATIYKPSPSPPLPRQEYPTENLSTFMSARNSYIDRSNSPVEVSSNRSLQPSVRRRPSQPTMKAPEISPLASRSLCVTPVAASTGNGSESANSRPLSDSVRPGITGGLQGLGHNDVDSVSKASTLDSVATSVQSAQPPHSATPTPSVPSTAYNSGSTNVNIGDVKLRNKSFLSANGQASVNPVSGTPSGTSNSDSGIRSDDEVDLMLSNGCPPPPAAPLTAPTRPLLGNRLSSELGGRGGGRESLGLGDFSSDLMSTFASWERK